MPCSFRRATPARQRSDSVRCGGGARTADGLRRLPAKPWLSGEYVSRSGTTVKVSISPAYASDAGVAVRWADFFASLLHGAELADLDAYVAPLAEVETICHAEAFG